MLVLSRRVGQQIRIGNSVIVTLLRVERNKARLGIEAPPGIPVYRQELLDFDRVRPGTSPETPRPSVSANGHRTNRLFGRSAVSRRSLLDNAAG